ncbi:MAG: preprotein translocase subunit SecG [Candidatus Omnitrophica bacterium]|nr:preprotein translocase subunit SecG [Candidatus Omnitrophota bacterium]
MFTFLIIVHVLTCILLAVVVLMQSGRGGGLTDGFAAAESMFGAQTNSVLIRATTVLAIIFLVTSLSLAFLSAQKDKSLLMNAGKVQEEFDPDKLFDEASENVQRIEINTNAENAVPPSETQK